VAVLKSVDKFPAEHQREVQNVAGDADRCSGILFNVKPNGTGSRSAITIRKITSRWWEFHNGIPAKPEIQRSRQAVHAR